MILKDILVRMKKAEVASLASNQIDFKTKTTPRDKEELFKMIRIIHQEDIKLWMYYSI